jgi:hypothetical protein
MLKIVDHTGACIGNATLSVTAGQMSGFTGIQPECEAWIYDGGFWFKDLIPGPLSLRVSAAGYVTTDTTMILSSGFQVVQLMPRRDK